jgi:hypothetical protein
MRTGSRPIVEELYAALMHAHKVFTAAHLECCKTGWDRAHPSYARYINSYTAVRAVLDQMPAKCHRTSGDLFITDLSKLKKG